MKKIFFFLSAFVFSSVLLNAKDYNDNGARKSDIQETAIVSRIGNNDLNILLPDYIFEGTNTKLELQFKDPKSSKLIENNFNLIFTLNGQDIPVKFDNNGKGIINHAFSNGEPLQLLFEDFSFRKELNIISLWMIIAPLAIIALLITLRLINLRNKKLVREKISKNGDGNKAQPEPAQHKTVEKQEREEKMTA